MPHVTLSGEGLTIAQTYAIAKHYDPVELDPEAAMNMAASRHMVVRYLDEERTVYGVTTGFGRFSEVVIPADKRQTLQVNLLRSHSAGVGTPFSETVVRGMMALRANALAKGYSGVRPVVVEQLVNLLNKNVVPVIPSQGSVGASGDLAPLAHLALVLIGEGMATYQGQVLPGAKALERAGLTPLVLEAKEGLALINGTQAMGAMGVLAVHEATGLADWADAAAALSIDVLRGIPLAFHPAVARVRPHPGQALVQQHLRDLLHGSQLTTSPGQLRVQDAYSLRTTPQVHGAAREGLAHIADVVTAELNSATDNPLLFADEDMVISAGNFHGEPLALVLDYLGIVAAEWASISERRIERMVNPTLSGLPAFLTTHGGLHSGLMLAQYTAASLVSENKVWAHPSSVDSIPTSANQEDHVSMGTTSARKSLTIVGNLRYVLAIELLAGAQAADLIGPTLLAPATRKVYEWVRTMVPTLEDDRSPAPDIEVVAAAMLSESGQQVLNELGLGRGIIVS
ncbi:histidine ammonia-lyase [Sulfobacillus sp. hq2]|uniref:histidine ammonia-lyase n=1 Tax=Sulfobacillus TaxID=28033 RepID=UPI000CD13838|nr:histidine ammonia-lyase [Sulfobacillus sp. hq2]POB09991.1 histidine ammonia-lyase [Sulfobacillus sp. hq2]